MRLHPTIEQHNLHRLAVGSSVLLKIPREQFTPLRRVIAFHNECTDDGTALRTKIQDSGITVSRREIVRIADSPDWKVGKSKPFVCADRLSLEHAVARANEAAKQLGRGYRFRVVVDGGKTSVLKTLCRCRRVIHRAEQYLRIVGMIRRMGVDCVGNVCDVELRDVRRVQRNFKHSLRFRAKQIADNTFQIRRTR
jgi:hypothetical protein